MIHVPPPYRRCHQFSHQHHRATGRGAKGSLVNTYILQYDIKCTVTSIERKHHHRRPVYGSCATGWYNWSGIGMAFEGMVQYLHSLLLQTHTFSSFLFSLPCSTMVALPLWIMNMVILDRSTVSNRF